MCVSFKNRKVGLEDQYSDSALLDSPEVKLRKRIRATRRKKYNKEHFVKSIKIKWGKKLT